METEEQESQLSLTDVAVAHLGSTRKWARLLSIVGFLFIGFAIIVVLLFVSQYFKPHGRSSFMAMIPMLVLALVYFFPIYFLWQFSNHSKLALENNSSASLETALKFLKRHYTFMGVLVIVVIVIYIFLGIGMFTSGAFRRF